MRKAASVLLGGVAFMGGILLDLYIFRDVGLFSLPVTLITVIFIGVTFFMWEAFKKGAQFATPTLFTETHRLKRFQDPIKLVNDGKMHWAIIPTGGFEYKKSYLSAKNFLAQRSEIVVMPARLLEAMGSRFHVGRVQLTELDHKAIYELNKLQSFRRVFDAFEQFPTKLYLGISSATLHPDSVDLKRANLPVFVDNLSAAEAELGAAYRNLDEKLDSDIRKLQSAKMQSEVSKMIVKAHDREEEEQR